MKLIALVVALLSSPAAAQNFYPALHDVTGVAANDVLNIRATPSARAPIIGEFRPFETDVEVLGLSDNGKWGRVNGSERAGWASMKFLARQPGQSAADWATGLAPVPLACAGTEPFWSLTLRPGGELVYASPALSAGRAEPGGYEAVERGASTGKRGFFGWLDTAPLGFTGVIANRECSDGMSDQLFGLELDLVRNDADGVHLVSGCCRVTR